MCTLDSSVDAALASHYVFIAFYDTAESRVADAVILQSASHQQCRQRNSACQQLEVGGSRAMENALVQIGFADPFVDIQ